MHDGKRMVLDENGDVFNGHYDILNWQLDDNGEISFVPVGKFNFKSTTKFELIIPNNSSIFWNTESSKVSCTDRLFYLYLYILRISMKCKTLRNYSN